MRYQDTKQNIKHSNGTSEGSVKMLSSQLPEVTEFKYLRNVILVDVEV